MLLICVHVDLENIHNPPLKRLEIPGGWGDSQRAKNLKKCTRLNWNFQRDGGSHKKSTLLGRYGYFMDLQNDISIGGNSKCS